MNFIKYVFTRILYDLGHIDMEYVLWPSCILGYLGYAFYICRFFDQNHITPEPLHMLAFLGLIFIVPTLLFVLFFYFKNMIRDYRRDTRDV